MGNKQSASGFNWKTTGEQAARNVNLHGKVAIVTGGNGGIGYETARVLSKQGANVVIACRDIKKGQIAVDTIKQKLPESQVQVMSLDLASFSSIKSFAENFKQLHLPLHILVNNAGVMNCPHTKTEDGFEMQFGTNHVGHFLLTSLLLDDLAAGAPSRVVLVSSETHRYKSVDFGNLNAEKSYSPFNIYAQSKTANILFSVELSRRFAGRGIYSNALHPGLIKTELTRHSNFWIFVYAIGFRLGFIKDAHQGAATSIYVATAGELERVGGKFYEDSNERAAMEYATNPEIAKQLWETTEQMIARASN